MHQRLAVEIYGLFVDHSQRGTPLDEARLDVVREALDAVEAAYAGLRASTRLDLDSDSPLPATVMDEVAMRAAHARSILPQRS